MTVTDRIEVNPKVMLGKPLIRGTRVPVELILRKRGHTAVLPQAPVRSASRPADGFGFRFHPLDLLVRRQSHRHLDRRRHARVFRSGRVDALAGRRAAVPPDDRPRFYSIRLAVPWDNVKELSAGMEWPSLTFHDPETVAATAEFRGFPPIGCSRYRQNSRASLFAGRCRTSTPLRGPSSRGLCRRVTRLSAFTTACMPTDLLEKPGAAMGSDWERRCHQKQVLIKFPRGRSR